MKAIWTQTVNGEELSPITVDIAPNSNVDYIFENSHQLVSVTFTYRNNETSTYTKVEE
jgi:hypothetical protein